jgi:peptide/nickel transport system substrate-binding protein
MRLPLVVLAALLFCAAQAHAQRAGGVLRILHRDSPGVMSIHEETSNSVLTPMMGVFNNLVLYDQHIAQASLGTIRPELATECNWSDDRTRLTFVLRDGVRWHDGKRFTAADVKCSWDRVAGLSEDRLRINPREGWFSSLAGIDVLSDHEVVFA